MQRGRGKLERTQTGGIVEGMADGEWGCRQPLRTIQHTATPQPPAAALFGPLPSTPLRHDNSITPHRNALTRFTAPE